ncbi:eCIS core domain-containing protein [Mesorhizobium ciceri]|uniref:eCIS core domain-containing protein n=1 Tax=Mesorhizobium ciceri biovar biserrulae (strain HAMBI 2942 / LMG 23838 / WSM1271) TaxID=765698 RepID=E8T8V8_MESCW|nr:DUF4157 domain-containing protein [Mesorhizobium ciceri]ADV13006.1 hypothetical protein Mesci_3890 [Mesorhizobium ciceri biovar biserrulae WSM1271]
MPRQWIIVASLQISLIALVYGLAPVPSAFAKCGIVEPCQLNPIKKQVDKARKQLDKAGQAAAKATSKAKRDAARATSKAKRDAAIAASKAKRDAAIAASKAKKDAEIAAKKAAQDAANATKTAVQAVADALNELQANFLTGPALEHAIRASHNSAIKGSMPIPPEIQKQLKGYSTKDSMKVVRYKIKDKGFVNLARLLEQGGFADAVTLIDVVVFRGPGEAADPSIWAHELKHVEQYQAWGVRRFAIRYARNSGSVEKPAYAKGNGFLAWQKSKGQ